MDDVELYRERILRHVSPVITGRFAGYQTSYTRQVKIGQPALMAIFVADLVGNVATEFHVAENERDRLKAEYLAKSGVNEVDGVPVVDSLAVCVPGAGQCVGSACARRSRKASSACARWLTRFFCSGAMSAAVRPCAGSRNIGL